MAVTAVLVAGTLISAGAAGEQAVERKRTATKARRAGETQQARQRTILAELEEEERRGLEEGARVAGQRRRRALAAGAGTTAGRRGTILTGPLGLVGGGESTKGAKTLLGA